VDLLNQAVARDPGFLLAYCRLAEAHDALYAFEAHDRTPKRLALAKAAIDNAFRLKPDSAEAHVASALHLYWGYLDYDHARDELAIAARTLPNNARAFELSGFIDRRQGRWPDAIRNLERASELDPRGRPPANLEDTYRMTRAYKQARAFLDRGPVFDPGDENIHQVFRAGIDLEERADTRPFHAAIEKILRDHPESSREWAIPRLWLAFYDRDSVAADRALAEMSDETFFLFIKEPTLITKACAQGLMARAKGDEAAARAAFSAARAEQEKAVDARPPDQGASGFLCVLGLIDAGLGRKEEALREARQAIELTPVAKNAIDGAGVLYCSAVICAWTGERDLAIEQLKTLVAIPCGASYGDLRLDPSWDPLRGDPRFEKIVASLAPKEMVSK
jgi:tetratricopeptide (TPR) repeat protein